MYIPINLTVWGFYMDVRLRNYILIKMQTNQKDLTLIPHKPLLEQAYFLSQQNTHTKEQLRTQTCF